MTGSRTCVVIVNRNAGDYLRRSLEALTEQTVAPQRVIVVDNASGDGSLAGIEERFPQFELVRSEENLGFAAGNNLAVRMCDDCEFVALLNPDAFPEPEWLERLLAAADAQPGSAAFGSRLVCADDPETLDGTGDQYHVSGLAWRRDQTLPTASRRDAGETFSVCAAAALYRRAAFLEVGGFDESFFCYYEDTDLAFRLRLAGHSCTYVPGAVAYHVGSATTGGRMSSFVIYHSVRNQLWTWVKNMPSPLLWLYLPQHLFLSFLTLATYSVHGEARAAFAGKRDGLRALPAVLAERRRIQASRTASPAELRRVMARNAEGYLMPIVIRAREVQRRRRQTPVTPATDAAPGEATLQA